MAFLVLPLPILVIDESVYGVFEGREACLDGNDPYDPSVPVQDITACVFYYVDWFLLLFTQ
jgi:hypothetical protein